MKTLSAFLKKEWMGQWRSGHLTVLAIIFILFGIMNPGIAKITPWLMETMSETLEQSGMTVTAVEVTAMDSWVQFFKNIPMALIVFVIIESSLFTKEYQSGTLILTLTKGLERYKVVVSKFAMLTLLWSAGYWMCFVITYAYSAYYWDNSVAQHLIFSAVCWWLYGMFAVVLTVLFSAVAKTNTAVLVGTGGVVFGFSLLGIIPSADKYLPSLLADGISLISGARDIGDYIIPVVITAVLCVAGIAVSIPLFNKKQL